MDVEGGGRVVLCSFRVCDALLAWRYFSLLWLCEYARVLGRAAEVGFSLFFLVRLVACFV